MILQNVWRKIRRFRHRKSDEPVVRSMPDINSTDYEFIRSFDAYTMTSLERRFHLLSAVRYIVKNNVVGAIVECGVWRGGSMMLAANALMKMGVTDRDFFLFDTFDGMPAPSVHDIDFLGRSAEQRLKNDEDAKEQSLVWAVATIEDVRKNIEKANYPVKNFHLVKGRVEETIPRLAPDRISLLRLDTDWYESTKHELHHLWPRLSHGGVIIIDDYGYWQGARRAVDEFWAELPNAPLLNRIDDTGRSAIKP